MDARKIIAKVKMGESLTVEEVKIYQANVKPEKQVYGKYGTLAKQYLEEHNFGKLLAIENLPEYLHGIDRQAADMYEAIYARLSKEERYKRTDSFLENYRRQTEMQKLIEEEILNELVYVA
ncbi:MAG: TnpV protein [Roseburia sp.]|nr:TnpV protein [Roseburia sp.]